MLGFPYSVVSGHLFSRKSLNCFGSEDLGGIGQRSFLENRGSVGSPFLTITSDFCMSPDDGVSEVSEREN